MAEASGLISRTVCLALVGVAVVLAAGSAAAAGRTALALVPAAEARLPADSLAALCERLFSTCAPASTKAMVETSAPQGRLYLLDSDRPWLAALDEHAPTDATRARVWDFSAYRHTVLPSADAGKPAALHVYPALYPVGASGHAVAIVSSTREMYSGGGALFDVADFVELDASGATSATQAKVVYAAVPFACSKTVRTCFSEKDYQRSPHCSDDSAGHLTIGFDGTTGAAPGWSFRWHEQSWPGNVAKAKQRWTRSAFAVPVGPREVGSGAAAQSASFCGGPAS